MIRLLMCILVAAICSVSSVQAQKHRDHVRVSNDTLKSDSLEYKLVVLDPGFETWLLRKPPMNYHSNDFYRIWNERYVFEWNWRYDHPEKYGDLFDTRIDYDLKTGYGIELNYRLYYYFQFFEETNRIKLLPR